MWNRWIWLFVLGLVPFFLYSAETDTTPPNNDPQSELSQEELSAMGIAICLQNPSYHDGILQTQSGGVITTPGVRIQAERLAYSRQTIEGVSHWTIEAEGNLMLDFRGTLFTGEHLSYDLKTQSGWIANGRTAVPPWFFGARNIVLCEDGSYLLYNGFVTTSQGSCPDWQIHTGYAKLDCERLLSAKDVSFRIKNISLLWLPSFQANLDSIFDAPVRYNFRWGGHEGPRAGISYELFSWQRFRMRGRLDYRLRSGLGGGIETSYRSLDHKLSCNTISYMAHDITRTSHKAHTRYRFQGCYHHQLNNDKTLIKVSYDKLSDRDMASDYADKGLMLETGQRTGCLIRHQEQNWIHNFVTNIRINTFQTLNQELPTLATSWKPFLIGNTGWVYDFQSKLSYLDFAYANYLTNVHDYHSSRIEFNQNIYRAYSNGALTFTPEIGCVAILYGNSPERNAKFLATGIFQGTLQSDMYRYYGENSAYKHVITPYLKFSYYTSPSVNPDDHYIFDIEDGWYRVSIAKAGILNNYYLKQSEGWISRLANIDCFTQWFFDPQKGARPIPKIYITSTLTSLPTLKHVISTAWDLQHNELDHLNFRTEWTVSSNIAFAAEFRHRSAWHWRKADRCNYVLDFFRSEFSLRHSPVSDRRDTLLTHLYWRFNPNWALELQSRSGWNRMCEPPYNEFEIDLYGTLRSAWQVRLSYQHREDDRRFAIYISLGLSRPDCGGYPRPCIEF